ncbi:MAG: hypothetical protein ACI8QT_001583 [Halioglobus sp.]
MLEPKVKTQNGSFDIEAGIHWDEISEESVVAVMKNSELLVDLILQKSRQAPEGAPYGS